MAKIIGLVGVIGSGKTYQRDLLIKQGFIPIDFKDELIDMASDLVGYNVLEDYDGFKRLIVGFQHPDKKIGHFTHKQIEEYSNGCVECYPLSMTGRRLLQRLGTEVMRKRDPDCWVNAWVKKARASVNEGKSVVVADVRFENELEIILSMGKIKGVDAESIFCDYKSDRYDASSTHPSEEMAQRYLSAGFKDGQSILAPIKTIPPKKQ